MATLTRMAKAKKLCFTVTNDLNYDQRMIRICTTLAAAGYEVTLVGVQRKYSPDLVERPFKQKRLPILADRGPLFFASYWTMLFFYLLFKRSDAICAIDLDTMLSVYYASKLKGCKRLYDAHELFTETKELVEKPVHARFWKWLAKRYIPRFPVGYTVGNMVAKTLAEKYGVQYPVITNATVLKPLPVEENTEAPFILYQGAVNKGRCFEELIPAMQWVTMPLVICGEGNFFEQTKKLVEQYKVGHKVTLKGYVPPGQLSEITRKAYMGLILLDDASQNNVYSLANRVFDYMHSAVPQLSMDFPEYRAMNEQFEIAYLLKAPLTPESIAAGINHLIADKDLHERLKHNALKAREVFNWQQNEIQLRSLYANLFKA